MNNLGEKQQPTPIISGFFETKCYKTAIGVTVMKTKEANYRPRQGAAVVIRASLFVSTIKAHVWPLVFVILAYYCNV